MSNNIQGDTCIRLIYVKKSQVPLCYFLRLLIKR